MTEAELQQALEAAKTQYIRLKNTLDGADSYISALELFEIIAYYIKSGV